MTLEGLSILVVEDEPVLGLALEDMLSDAGARPLMAQTLPEAWAILGDQEPEAAVLDINICGELSYPFAQALQQRGIPFVFATGYGAALHTDDLAHVPTIAKPYTFAEVESALRGLGG